MSALLEVSNLRRCFGALTAVESVSFRVAAGESFGLLGPNGAGKSTTMNMLVGLLTPDSGQVVLAGHSVTEQPLAARRILGVVPQDLAVYPELTAEENLRFFGQLYDLAPDRLSQRVDAVLGQVGLQERRADRAGDFSGGMKRRLNFAAAILHEPQLLILDEPTVGVDPHSRSHLLDCVRQLRDQGTAIIYCSHYMEEVEAVCSRVAVMDHGQVLICDTLENLMARVPRRIELEVSGTVSATDLSLGPHDSVTTRDGVTVILLQQTAPLNTTLTSTVAGTLQTLADLGKSVTNIRTHESSLERLFLELTGTRLRD